MGGEGSMLHAIKSLKNNRALVKKRKSRSHNDLLLEGTSKTKIEFKKVSADELERIKAEIRLESRKAKLKELVIFLIVVALMIALVIWIYSSA